MDVGTNQLALEIGAMTWVVSMNSSISAMPSQMIFAIPFASIDVSFISLDLSPALHRILVDTIVVALVKPQFEAGREQDREKWGRL